MYNPIGFEDNTDNRNIYTEQVIGDNVFVTRIPTKTPGTLINTENMNHLEKGIEDIHRQVTGIVVDARKQLKLISFLRWELEVISGNPSVDMSNSCWFSFIDKNEINLISGTITEFGFGL